LTLFFLLTAFFQNLFSQENKSITGKITDQKGNPISGASIYLSQTSKGVTSSAAGEFQLENLPDGKYNLVISAIGYETKIIHLSSESYPGNLKIILDLRAVELAEVVVQANDNDGWRRYGKYFIENFIGTTRNAKYCKIINRDVIRFRFSDKNNRLIAKADEPIIIENKILGYKIKFQLIEFTADFNTDIVAYYGYPLFTDLEGTNEKILNNRRQAYYGSLMHFVRAVYENKLAEEKFIVRATLTKRNLEKDRVKNILESYFDSTHVRNEAAELSFGLVRATSSNENTISRDSLRYYKKVIKQRDTLTQKVSPGTLNEFVSDVTAYSKSLFFTHELEIFYNNKKSEIMLKTPAPLEILRNGSYFSPTELVTFKYLSEHEKICNMLPLDYYP
jgi:hypothetical protein